MRPSEGSGQLSGDDVKGERQCDVVPLAEKMSLNIHAVFLEVFWGLGGEALEAAGRIFREGAHKPFMGF